MNKPFYLAIEGAIGVGKTTLARMLQPRFEAELLLEVFEENPFLSDFYADRDRYAFQTQIFFLLSRYRQQQNLLIDGSTVLSDYTFAKDRLFAYLNLDGDELTMYEKVHHALAEKVTVPDLVVYLQANLDLLMARIAMRDRPYERSMDPAYIESLRQAYEEHFENYTATSLLVINVNELDFVRSQDDLSYIEGCIRNELGAAGARAWMTASSAESSQARTRQWRLVEEFLALTEAVGALGSAISAGSNNAVDEFRAALASSNECLRRIEEGAEADA